MYIAIPSKYPVAQVVGFMKGKSAIHIARGIQDRARGLAVQSSWERGYFVSTVGREEKMIREYIRKQEQEDKRIGQLKFRLQAFLRAALSGSQIRAPGFAGGGYNRSRQT